MRALSFLIVMACLCGQAFCQQQLAVFVPVASSANAQVPLVCPFAFMYQNGNLYYYYAAECNGQNPQGMLFDKLVATGCNAAGDKCNYEMAGEALRQYRNNFRFVTLLVQQKKKDAKTVVKYNKKAKQKEYLPKDADIVVPEAMKDKVKKIGSQLVKVNGAKKPDDQYFRVYEVKYTMDNGDEFFFITGQEVDRKTITPKDAVAIGAFKNAAKDIVVVGIKEYHVTLKEE